MEKDRLLAMTDGVAAVIITIMVLELKAPVGDDFQALHELWPVFFAYVLSFIYVAIYWNNHHHYFHLVPRVNGAVMWANVHLLFWMSLIPFTTAWLGEHAFMPVPMALYGVSLLMPAVAWWIMQRVIIRSPGEKIHRLRPSWDTISKVPIFRNSYAGWWHRFSPSGSPGWRCFATWWSPSCGWSPTGASKKW